MLNLITNTMTHIYLVMMSYTGLYRSVLCACLSEERAQEICQKHIDFGRMHGRADYRYYVETKVLI